MIEQFTFYSNLTFAIVTFILALFFISFPVNDDLVLKNYKISLKILAISYFSITSVIILGLIFKTSDGNKSIFSFLDILIASLQALLFGFTLVTLVNPFLLTFKNIVKQLLPIIIFSILIILPSFFIEILKIEKISIFYKIIRDSSIILNFLFLLFYIFQLIYFSILILKEFKKYKNKLENYFSDTQKLNLKWVKYAYFASLIIAVSALISMFFSNEIISIIFTIVFILFYLFFALEYIKYTNIYIQIKPVIEIIDYNTKEENKNQTAKSRFNWSDLKSNIIEEKYYLKESVNIEEIAQWLSIGRTTLSNFINSEEKMNFNSWINSLRIEDSKNILIENPQKTVAEISEMVGFSEQSNFSKQFKLITGESPSSWRKKSLVF